MRIVRTDTHTDSACMQSNVKSSCPQWELNLKCSQSPKPGPLQSGQAEAHMAHPSCSPGKREWATWKRSAALSSSAAPALAAESSAARAPLMALPAAWLLTSASLGNLTTLHTRPAARSLLWGCFLLTSPGVGVACRSLQRPQPPGALWRRCLLCMADLQAHAAPQQP